MRRRIAITGAGWVTPLGAGIADVWENLTEGRSGVRPITVFDASNFPVQLAAEVRDWDVDDVGEDPAEWRHEPRQLRFAVGAAVKAVEAAGLKGKIADPARFGVALGYGEVFPDLARYGEMVAAALGGGELRRDVFLDKARSFWNGEGPLNYEPHMASHRVAAMFDAQGPNTNCIAGCASSTQAIGAAMQQIRAGEADVMLAGGSHSMIHSMGVSGLHRLSVLSTSNELMGKAMRPFDRDRDGFVVGEGGAIVVLEDLDHALARGAEIWGELTGYGAAHDAYRVVDTHPQGRALADSVREALRDARLAPNEIDYVNAHGTSTRLNDRVETAVLKEVLGDHAYKVPISSMKSMIGHLTTACGAVELVSALMTIRTGVIPPTINLETPDPQCDLDYVPQTAREARCRHALSTNLGFGGHSAALIVSQYDEASR